MARLDTELVRRGLARSRTQAAKLIADGAVSVDGAAVTRSSHPVADQAAIEVAATEHGRYASRAGHKLAGALAAFPAVDPRGARCLDAGASTGGFTDVLLQAGAAEVVAVDVGHGQLVESLRHDPRVRVHEGLNVREMTPADIGGTAALAVADLSFISLTLVLAPLAACTDPGDTSWSWSSPSSRWAGSAWRAPASSDRTANDAARSPPSRRRRPAWGWRCADWP
ncbi:hypothetical protein SCMU_16850 [Sinomonas cyclohexanicum]|uniref:RNA-binding S4 domain-containing protein n=1 Tax=Sinomonas cyclohexanicum TaxID=322009 RepID=A0ABN6FGK2_SINCY|nr:TlyA family RNA methyltransferase [Corynebacterium cyclohexanicum]BCT75843.1 hypothetical protein SCMU_16850 [Corynebacterium cyclohexanicum]